MRNALLLLIAVTLVACSDEPAGAPDSAPPDAALADGAADAADPLADAGPPPGCGSGSYVPAAGLTELKWFSGAKVQHIRAQTWTITSNNVKYDLSKVPLHQAVRFELEHPAEVHGFAVQWENVPTGAKPTDLLTAGLYRDFGHNGFDFWAKEPLWTGARCVKDHKQGGWLTYGFGKPVKVAQPGLVYVAHRADKPSEPVFGFDDSKSSDGKCDKFAKCHSSLNLPTSDAVPKGMNFNGLSFSFQYNFRVKLLVKYTRQVKAADRMFQQDTAVKAASSSVSWGDYDNDGWDDLLVGGTLYHNVKGKLTDVTKASGITALKTSATGGTWGDYDNDGCLDLLLFAESMVRADTLLKGDCKGGFTDVTAKAGITDQQSYNSCGAAKNIRAPTAAAAWIDIDSDGYLDLYLANFICWAQNSYYKDTVFHNKGDGTFEEWTAKKGFSNDTETASRGAAPVDFDNDGDVDLFVLTYRLQKNIFFINNGDGTVSDKGDDLGFAGNPRFFAGKYYYGHTIGAAWGDLDNDGDFDLVAANLAHPRFFHFSDRTQILINDGKGKLVDKSGLWKKPYGNPSGLRYQETHSVPVLGDFDNDGILDLAITAIYDGRPTDFYWGQGDGTFKLDVHSTGIQTKNGWGVSAADYDNDGDLDLYATGLWVNKRQAASSARWLQVRAVGGKKSNRAAIGATVRIKVGSKSYMRHVQGGTGKGCQDSMYLHFGLGSATSVDQISVAFPGAGSVTYKGPFKADQRVWVYEDGKVFKGWAPKP